MGDEVPELVAYDAGTVFTEAKARSLEEIFAEGQVIFQAMYMADSEPLDAFQNAVQDGLSQSYSTVRSQDYIFEVMPQGATKASGLKHLAEKLEIAPNQIMALGDAANDLEMLQFVGQSVAMGNASDDIKALCKYVTLTNDEAGVAHAIRTWLYKEKRPLALLFAKGFSISDNGNESSKCDSDISDGSWVSLNGQIIN